MTLYDFDLIDVHSGSIRVFVRKGIHQQPEKIFKQIVVEKEFGITTSHGFMNFSYNVAKHIELCKATISELVAKGRSVVGFGASGRCNIFCNLLKLGTENIKYIFDQSPERTNRFIPAVNIPIIKFDEDAASAEYDVVLIFAWNFANMIKKKIKAKNYLILFPEPIMLKEAEMVKGIL
jgi:hypothetical protein